MVDDRGQPTWSVTWDCAGCHTVDLETPELVVVQRRGTATSTAHGRLPLLSACTPEHDAVGQMSEYGRFAVAQYGNFRLS